MDFIILTWYRNQWIWILPMSNEHYAHFRAGSICEMNVRCALVSTKYRHAYLLLRFHNSHTWNLDGILVLCDFIFHAYANILSFLFFLHVTAVAHIHFVKCFFFLFRFGVFKCVLLLSAGVNCRRFVCKVTKCVLLLVCTRMCKEIVKQGFCRLFQQILNLKLWPPPFIWFLTTTTKNLQCA